VQAQKRAKRIHGLASLSSTEEQRVPKKQIPTTETPQPFGERLALLRKEAGFSQRAFAKELGISQRMVAYYEGQTDHPPTQLLPALVEVLGVSADELLGIKPITNAKASRIGSERLWRRFKQIEKLSAADRKQLLTIVDTFLERAQLAKKSA
jgi:transcriptional regulator with XRE-family HTH domain